MFNIPKIIFLFGHRKQHGKDTCASIMESILDKCGVSCKKTSFAKKLKKCVAEKYNLSYEKMDYEDYKKSIIEPYNKTVREILIQEGNLARSFWPDIWACHAYQEIFESNCEIGIISDFRFPNEFDEQHKYLKYYLQKKNIEYSSYYQENYKVYKILVLRENGTYINDGADDALPDEKSYYDYLINNPCSKDWKNVLSHQIKIILKETYFLKYNNNKECFQCLMES
ncbi:MAG: hypothetical protein NZZ41_04875 [Candidatus Dojkabacteria bacterium]|nr:hypothetical protein [Candidatus Dojkabacteria bacterium]